MGRASDGDGGAREEYDGDDDRAGEEYGAPV